MKQNKIYIQNFWYVNNYGACLTAFALYQILEKLNYDVSLIDISQIYEKKIYIFKKFISRYCTTTNWIKTIKDIENINKSNAIFITGSDQVFRAFFKKKRIRKYFEYFLLDYVLPEAKKISFSASYGVNKENFIKETDQYTIENMKTSLKSFDFISVRENSGVEICKDLFDVDAKWIIDPVFILDKKYYENLVTQSKKDFSGKIVSCMFDKINNNLDKFLSKKYNTKVIELWKSNLSIEEWLSAIKNCKFLITNSYHAMCFAIIFNKPFIALSKDKGASARFESLFKMLEIEDQSINNNNEIYENDCIFKVNYAKVNQRIDEERQRGLDLLKKALEAPIDKKEEKFEARMKFLENKVYELETQISLTYKIKNQLVNFMLFLFYKYLPGPIISIAKLMRFKNAKK